MFRFAFVEINVSARFVQMFFKTNVSVKNNECENLLIKERDIYCYVHHSGRVERG